MLDINIMRYAYKNDDQLDSHVPSSLAYTEHGFLLAVGNKASELEFIPIAHLTNEALFAQCRIHTPSRINSR